MPIFKVGDLVVPRYIDEPDDWDAVGLIVGMRDTQLDVIFRVLWSDASEPRWTSRQSISVMIDTDTDTKEVSHGNQGD
jgi:hypothetical protein